MGLTTIAQAMKHPDIHAYLRKVMLSEVALHVWYVLDKIPQSYLDLIEQRFSNQAIHDTVRRVAYDGASRHTGAVLPVVRAAVAHGTPLYDLALTQALWARMCAGYCEDGSAILARSDAHVWLTRRQVYGALADGSRFASAFRNWLALLYEQGVEATLRMFLAQEVKVS